MSGFGLSLFFLLLTRRAAWVGAEMFFQTGEGEKLGLHLAFPRWAIGVGATFSSTGHLDINEADSSEEQFGYRKSREKNEM